MHILHIAGPSQVGKTRLITALIPILPAALVLKWSHHRLPPDKPGSDTAEWGAVSTGPILFAASDGIIWRGPYDRLAIYRLLAPRTSLLIVEGDKGAPWPKIVISPEWIPSIQIALWISPVPPEDPAIPWIAAELPLSDSQIAAIRQQIGAQWSRLCHILE